MRKITFWHRRRHTDFTTTEMFTTNPQRRINEIQLAGGFSCQVDTIDCFIPWHSISFIEIQDSKIGEPTE